MKRSRLGLGFALSASLGIFAQTATSEELSVATFLPPQHHSNTGMFAWFGKEIEARSAGSLTMKLYPAGQLGAGPVQQYKRVVEGADDKSKMMIEAATDRNYEWIVVSDEERTKMDAAVASGLETIFADYEGRGISNARDIYGALNK